MIQIDPVRLEEATNSIKEYVKEDNIEPLISALENLQQDPDNESLIEQFLTAFNNLGIIQGSVLTYAPYLILLLSDNLFRDE